MPTSPLTLRVSDGRFADVRIEALVHPEAMTPSVRDAVAAALNGAPADLPAGAVAARVRAAVPFGADLVGTTPQEFAEAARRAAGVAANPDRVGAFTTAEIDRLAADWSGLGWRIIPERPLPSALNVALDEVLADRVAKGQRRPTLRFWGWAGPAVVVGRSQAVANEVDPGEAAAAGIAVVRRMTGGGAMFVTPGGAITFSLYLPDRALAGLSIRQSYEVCDAWAVLALRAAGVDAHYVPVNDVGWAGGKIAGAAQARRAGVVLHHTTMAYSMDAGEMARVLRIGRARRTERAVGSAPKVVSPLDRQTTLSRDEFVARLTETFRGKYGGEPDEITADEWSAAERLVAEKYGTEAWTKEFG